MTDRAQTPARVPSTGVYWVLRVVESALLLASLVGIGLFAWSVVDILGIGTTATSTKHLPASVWPGILLFVGAMLVLQVVRVVLQRYRREDGSPRGDARGVAAAATTDALAALEDEEPATGTSIDTRKV